MRIVINNLINEGYEPRYLYYLVQLGASQHWLHHPFGLYKVVDNRQYINDFNELKARHQIKNIKQKEVGDYEIDDNFKFWENRKIGFSRILRW